MTADAQMTAGTYEVLRNRLREAAATLRQRLEKLNADRADTFGNITTQLLATERVTTEHNCVPRDLVAIGDHFLFGYNVQFGLKTETNLQDVFAAYRLEGLSLHGEPLDRWLHDDRFLRDFHELYRFYKQTTFTRFFAAGPFIHMVFQVGKAVSDIKTFKWRFADSQLQYIDSRSEHEVRYPPQHEFQWQRSTRDQHHYGPHPHISVDDRVFVETVGGDLTIKVENNTASGQGIYAEPVDNADQTLDDAEVYYALLGNLVLLKIRPYQERDFRYLLYNDKLKKAMRLDDIQHACVLLPDDQGIIFPGGYYLQTGEFKRFDHGLSDMIYERSIASPNGEDFLYLFINQLSGTYIQLRYNLIRQEVDTPMICHGQSFFEGGQMICFKAQEEPQKHHALQIWQTPFTGPDFVAHSNTDSLLFKIGNKELVRGMAECSEILQLIHKEDNYAGLYVDLVKKASGILDSYFWLDKAETHRLDEPLRTIREAASAAVEEYDKVVRVRRDTEEKTAAVAQAVADLTKRIHRERFERIDDFVAALAELRAQRGHAMALRELRYVELDRVETLETETAEQAERLSRRCVEYLLQPGSLDSYRQQVAAAGEQVAAITTGAEAKKLNKEIDRISGQLELLTETVSNLRIEDTTKRTQIIDAISEVFSSLNRVRSSLKARAADLASSEGRAEFGSQLKLLEQTVAGYLDVADTPEKCDGYLTKVMVQLEELEGRFAEFDEFVAQLTEKREELYNAFESRKVQLIEKRNRHAETLAAAANRILAGIESRTRAMDTADAILAYFASDLMVEKVRGIVDQLQQLDDAVRVEDIQSRLKTIREDSIRQLKDRQDLYEDGGDAIRLGRHRFAVNTQSLDVTTVLRDGQLNLHLTGTQFFEPLEHEALAAARDLWGQELVSENAAVYRAEYLAVSLFDQLRQTGEKLQPAAIDAAWIQRRAGDRYAEGYTRGVHDSDAAAILRTLLEIDAQIGLLRHRPVVRAAALLWWDHLLDAANRNALAQWIGGFASLAKAFPGARPAREFRERLAQLFQPRHQGALAASAATPAVADDPLSQLHALFPEVRGEHVAQYLFQQLTADDTTMVASRRASELYRAFCESLPADNRQQWVAQTLRQNADRPLQAFVLARNWAEAFLQSPSHADSGTLDPAEAYRDELAVLILRGGTGEMQILDAKVAAQLDGLAGAHGRIQETRLTVHYHELLARVRDYQHAVVPRFLALHATKASLVEQARQQMRLEEFRPRVLTSFVRNRLLDEVYLPMIGDNLAKQMGVAGEAKRTDRMGLLLLISPPGYGKTTLMEYVANRLGLVFMKINGPAIGYGVTSLDPAEAPNAAAREEIQRLNLALEMGDNVMLYLDDIQHTHPELLQKFISLCDATRKIEGVRNGQTRTYDLRGRRVAVVMAGNPYTESGERFQIPDMLSNRADVYNLGEIIGASRDAFEISYLENCLTSNEVLAPLAAGSPEDARRLIRAAELDSIEGVDLEGNWSADQVREMMQVLRKLLRIRDVVLKVNRQYIRSAAQADAYRTEPPFKLQGSYRNMNRMAERVVPVMNAEELQALIIGSYEQDAQTLTTDNEANVLKFKELIGILTPEEQTRWDSIKYAFVESVRMSGLSSDDQAGQLMRQLASMRDGLESIRKVLALAVASHTSEAAEEKMDQRVDSVRQGLSVVGDRLATVIEATAKQLESIHRQQALSPPEQKVLVQHKVPRVMVDLVQGQFHLMQEWLRPLLAESLDNGRDLDQLRTQIETTLAVCNRMRSELDAAVQADHDSQ